MPDSISYREKIIQTIRITGPVIPIRIAKILEKDIITASAMLSELVSKNIIKISHLKIGNSPLYYLPGQEHRLQEFADYLKGPEKKAYDLLREKKILRNSHLDPAIRVALQHIKDFAIPIEVRVDNNRTEIFWKWYLLPPNEAEKIIKQLITNSAQGEIKNQPTNKEEINNYENVEGIGMVKEKEKEEFQERGTGKIDSNKGGFTSWQLQEKRSSEETSKTREAKEISENEKIKLVKKTKQLYLDNENEASKEEQNKEKDKEEISDSFMKSVINYCNKNNIEIKEYQIVRKNADIELTLEFTSPLGKLRYYVKALNKKKISETDIKNAFIKGELKRLPVAILFCGELTKKASQLVESKLRWISLKKIEG